MKLEQVSVNEHKRKLFESWSFEISQDIEHILGLDLEEELMIIMNKKPKRCYE